MVDLYHVKVRTIIQVSEMISNRETGLDKPNTEIPQDSSEVRSKSVAPMTWRFALPEGRVLSPENATRDELLYVITHILEERNWWKEQAQRRLL